VKPDVDDTAFPRAPNDAAVERPLEKPGKDRDDMKDHLTD
jgi:hypothetical protein